jgi:tetratricopeptide (TPR) repeat protein
MAARLLTLVFTDLVNSTAIKSLPPGHDLPSRNQAYRDTIQSPHHERVVARLAEAESRIVKNLGGGCFLVFNDIVKAVRWAIDLLQSRADAEASHHHSLPIWRELTDPRGDGNALKQMGRLLQLRERHDESESVSLRALGLIRRAGDPVGEAKTLAYLANVYRFQRRWNEATKVYEQGLNLSRRVGDRYDEGEILRHLGQVYH